jgi:hypothetical protein
MLFIELEFDQDAFNKFFSHIDNDAFKSGSEKVELISGEVVLPSFKIVDQSFQESVRAGLA